LGRFWQKLAVLGSFGQILFIDYGWDWNLKNSSNSSILNPNATWSVSLENYHSYLQPQKVSKNPQIHCIHSHLPKNVKSHFGSLGPLGLKIPSKYIAIPSKNLTCLWQYHNTLIYFNVLPYTLKLSYNLSIPHLFVLSLYCFSKLSWRLIILQKCHYTCHDIFISFKQVGHILWILQILLFFYIA
jgi:hypothetical protein